MKILLLLPLVFLGCSPPNDFRIGSKITNGFCTGIVSEKNSDQYKIVAVRCGSLGFNYLFIPRAEAALVSDEAAK